MKFFLNAAFLTGSIALLATPLPVMAETASPKDSAIENAKDTPGITETANPETAVDYKKIQNNDIVIGQRTTPNTIIEYASLSCSHCAKFHIQAFPPILTDIIETGEAALVFRHYPLNEPALRAAMLVDCATGEQQATFIKVLFKTQDNWAYTQDFTGALRTIAKLGGIEEERFNQCLEDKTLEDAVINSRKIGAQEFHVQSTPTFIVNGVLYTGPRTVEGFRDFFRQTGDATPPANAETGQEPAAKPANE